MVLDQIKRINDSLQLLKQFVESDDIKQIKAEKSDKEYREHLQRIFPLFYEDFPSLFDMVIEGKDTTFINRMFDALIQIDKGKSKEQVEKQLGEELAKIYLYPKIGNPKH